MENKRNYTKADELLDRIGIDKYNEDGELTLRKDELAAQLGLNLSSLWGRIGFFWITHRIYHFGDEQLVFMELQPGVYTLGIENPAEDCEDIQNVEYKHNHFCSDQQ